MGSEMCIRDSYNTMGSVDGDRLVSAILGVIIPPLEVFRKHKCGAEFWIDLVLWLLLLLVGGIFYCFHLKKVDIVHNILSILLPPIAVYLKTKDCVSTIITLVLMFFGWFPAIIASYYFCM